MKVVRLIGNSAQRRIQFRSILRAAQGATVKRTKAAHNAKSGSKRFATTVKIAA